ncbi:hypothetical protein HPB48_008997 [Haemaphysalis longicornis]|uniref:Uncharacterized protein n=1 Tax=Haemaphysalis longicornis TaxID=44386 RepID=A0A9J6H3V7_HAELO|nr:hypothetical protein HPB48_008997 [Haemaphysalis longicornis]
MAAALPEVPERLKCVAPYVKIAAEHDSRDPVIAYWCRLYALQTGMKVDRSSSECRGFLMAYMDWLEKVANHRKYARWKAAYIHRCLKNGEAPVPGPLKGDDEGFEEDAGAVGGNPSPSNGPAGATGGSDGFPPLPPGFAVGGAGASGFSGPSTSGQPSFGDYQPMPSSLSVPTPGSQAPPSTPSSSTQPSPSMAPLEDIRAANGVALRTEDFNKAQKYCKFAGSALQYEDVPTAIENLQKALRLLTTGSEGP